MDDSAVVRILISFFLSLHQASVVFEAENGQICIDRMRQADRFPSVIILDIEMPVMDGFETAKILKREWPFLKIIAYSSKNDKDSIKKLMANGKDFFVTKQDDITQPLIEILKHLSEE
ncbi:response regulator [Dyadobacter sp. CY356]|uniref:response regulator n=1 Tax=Dyadobacter sp. CY356 TaxID=2906442 RepID=UPI001F1BF556|nr:response regulator [Dyadobacter sp. CY356]MCF0055131.1 response regulator [Dyadobacter sp. CY356]